MSKRIGAKGIPQTVREYGLRLKQEEREMVDVIRALYDSIPSQEKTVEERLAIAIVAIQLIKDKTQQPLNIYARNNVFSIGK